MFKVDVIMVNEKGVLNKLTRALKGRDCDAMLLSHPAARGILYTVINFKENTAAVISTREAARRYVVVSADTREFTEDVARSVLDKRVTEKAVFAAERLKI